MLGADTTASSLSNAVFHLLNNPETLRRLTKEIRSTFSYSSDIRTDPTLQQCKYLSACIDESLRLTPPVGGCLQRLVPSGGVTIEDHYIPAGTDVGVPHHAVMRDERYYIDPWSFKPNRWIQSARNTEEIIRKGRSAFCPFGLGPTGCIGKAWALIELKLTIAHLVFRYDLEWAVPDEQKELTARDRLRLREDRSVDRFVVSASEGISVRVRNGCC